MRWAWEALTSITIRSGISSTERSIARWMEVSRMATRPFSRMIYPQMGAVAGWSQMMNTREAGPAADGSGIFRLPIG
jgi:hypothetical protein